MADCATSTQTLMNDPEIKSIFEATFTHDGFVARADIIVRDGRKWRLIEVKSSLDVDDDHIADIAYTYAVATLAGLNASTASLMLINKSFRLGMPDNLLFVTSDQTAAVRLVAADVTKAMAPVRSALTRTKQPAAVLAYHCKDCPYFATDCVGKGVADHIFEIPRLGEKKFQALVGQGITTIDFIPDDFALTEPQDRVRQVTTSKQAWMGPNLRKDLDKIAWPAHYLDFETCATAIPLYPDVGPYEAIPFQYSLHVIEKIAEVPKHFDFLADGSRDPRRELAEQLVRHLGTKGSIVAYSPYEKRTITVLAKLFPDLSLQLNACLKRLVDMEAILKDGYSHPDFHGRSSIKVTLPALVPSLSYDGLEIADGMAAQAIFAVIAQGRCSSREKEKHLAALRTYCAQDSLGMLELHAALCRAAT